jgi:hypothetical protein
MKRRTKKLSLNRETLRNLQADALLKAAGRGPGCTLEDDTTCVCTLDCNSGGTGTQTCGCPSGFRCPSDTWEDWTCCDC